MKFCINKPQKLQKSTGAATKPLFLKKSASYIQSTDRLNVKPDTFSLSVSQKLPIGLRP